MPRTSRSLALMRRLGVTFDHAAQITDNGQVFDAVVYAITRDQWRRAAKPLPILDD